MGTVPHKLRGMVTLGRKEIKLASVLVICCCVTSLQNLVVYNNLFILSLGFCGSGMWEGLGWVVLAWGLSAHGS